MGKILFSAFRGEPLVQIVIIPGTIIFVLLNTIIDHIQRVKFPCAKNFVLLNINIQMWLIFLYNIPQKHFYQYIVLLRQVYPGVPVPKLFPVVFDIHQQAEKFNEVSLGRILCVIDKLEIRLDGDQGHAAPALFFGFFLCGSLDV
jgi:hypothetical protein